MIGSQVPELESRVCRVPPGVASDKDQGRLLREQESRESVPNVPNSTFSDLLFDRGTGSRRSRVQHTVLWLKPNGQFHRAEKHCARTHQGLGHPASKQTQTLSLADVARDFKPPPTGWIEYYGRYAP